MKRFITILLMACILLGCLPLSGCAGKPPAMEEVYDRLVYVIEESMKVNTVIFGEGLPVYERDSELAELSHMYYGFNQNGVEIISPYSRYASIGEIRDAMARVYSKEYRESLEEMLFTGYAYTELQDAVLSARYTEDSYWFYQAEDYDALTHGMRVYDYASMTILPSSNATYLKISVQSYSESNPSHWSPRELTFIHENGNWYLDVPSC